MGGCGLGRHFAYHCDHARDGSKIGWSKAEALSLPDNENGSEAKMLELFSLPPCHYPQLPCVRKVQQINIAAEEGGALM